jgi:hypothetical protein
MLFMPLFSFNVAFDMFATFELASTSGVATTVPVQSCSVRQDSRK